MSGGRRMSQALRAPRRVAWLGVVVGAAMVIEVVAATPASAHATLAWSSPADGAVLPALPPALTLRFDEPVRPVAADIQVVDPAGHGVTGVIAADGAQVRIRLRPDGAQGTYALTWRVISADSHPVGGAITFSVGHPSTPASVRPARTDTVVAVLFTGARFVGFAGFAVLFGALAFCCYGMRGAVAIRGVRQLITFGWAALAAGTLGALVLEGPYAAGTGAEAMARPDLIHQTLATTYGTAVTARLLMLGLLPFLIAGCRTRLEGDSRTGRVVFGAAVAMAAVAIAVTWPFGGHAAAGAQPLTAVAADTAHLCAMALWVGGLAAVTVTTRARRTDPRVGTGVRRFSTVAAGSVALLAGTGLYQGWLRVQTPQALLQTAYGVTLVLKTALVCAVLSVAFFSRRTLRTRLGGPVPDRLVRLVTIETAGVVAVLVVTAVLVAMEPAGKALAAKPVTLITRYDTGGAGGTGTLSLRLPSRVRGLTTATVVVRDAAGHPRGVAALGVAWSLPRRDIGPITAKVTPAGVGRYVAVTAPLTVPGRWTVAVTVRTGDIDETTVTLTQAIR
ncbi:copper resistance protein CopC [Actinoallomurus sp. NPDC052274]|uniref:copper resistance CopC/CopD family protein n=1 Tax=Actinoallomurus sp. NPDC052274 TaxID=3155420 RepID=UPI0034177E6D